MNLKLLFRKLQLKNPIIHVYLKKRNVLNVTVRIEERHLTLIANIYR